jgi:sterol desaturase/sphingolipid hydroxylase (fatty acid hydroxylase superfamily)
MHFGQVLANWPWVLGYIVAATIVFIALRRRSSTDEQAANAAHSSDGFGSSKSLAGIAAAFFRLTCPKLLLLLLATAWTARLLIGQWSPWDVAVVAGVLAFWPVQEWLIHVFLLHLKPFTLMGRQIDPIISRNHRNHHLNPWDPVLGVTPPHMIWLYVAGLPGVWLLMLPLPLAASGVAVYFALVLNYEWVHYLIHTSYAPRTWFYKRLWLNHRLHHFKNEQYWYGVTMLSGDRILGTQPKPQETSRSETVLTLGVTEESEGPLIGVAPPVAHEPGPPAEFVSDSRT